MAELPEVLREFRDRHARKLPDTVRYKRCPVCATYMTRRAYARVSGVIVDVWCDQAAFQEIASFIARGGDVLAARSPSRRRRR